MLFGQNCAYIFQGDKIKSELAALVQDLPKVFDGVAAKSQNLKNAVKYYQDFRSFLINRHAHVDLTVD